MWREISAYTNYIILFTYILYILYIVHVFAGGRRLGPQDTDSQERAGPEEMGAVSAEARLRSAARARGRVATSSLRGNLVANWRASGYHKAIGWALSSCSSRR